MAEPHLRDLIDVITRVADRLKRLKSRDLNEASTKTTFIEPVLDALGWEVREFEEVRQEYRHSKDDNPVDYAFMLMGEPQFFLEAKSLGRSLDDPGPMRQVLNYANNAGVIWCVLANGDEWRFYKSTEPVRAEKKQFCSVTISQGPPEHVAKVLRLLAKSSIQSDQLEEFWSGQAVARDVKAALDQMIPNADKALSVLLAKKLRNHDSKNIGAALRKLRVQIDLPRLPEFDSRGGTRGRKGAARDGRKPAAGTTSLRDLVQAGLISAPLRIFCTYHKVLVEGRVRADGVVEFDGREFDSCSAAGAAAKGKVTGDAKATNGWVFWRFTDSEGAERFLEYARSQFEARAGGGRKEAGA